MSRHEERQKMALESGATAIVEERDEEGIAKAREIFGGGAASVTTYDKQILLKAVLDGDINPGRVFTHTYKLEEIDRAYKDIDEHKAIKSMIVIE